jgi:hypothetical protein
MPMQSKSNSLVDEYPQLPLILNKKTFPHYNILIGYDDAQIHFAEIVTGVECVKMASIRDEDILGKPDRLFRVDNIKLVELSPDTQAKVGIWSLTGLTKGSSGANALVRYSGKMLDIKLDQKMLNRVAYEITRNEIEDLRGAVWQSVEILVDGAPETSLWPEPWQSRMGWLPKGVDPSYRLNTLYHTLVGFVFAKDNDWDSARKIGVSANKFARYKDMQLDLKKTYDSLVEISMWRSNKLISPFTVILKISHTWN